MIFCVRSVIIMVIAQKSSAAKFVSACANNSGDVIVIIRARESAEVSGNALVSFGSRGGEFLCVL